MRPANLAALISCHNRKEQTLQCIRSLHEAKQASKIRGTISSLTVYVLDDGSTDETSTAIMESFPDTRILEGSGNLFWCKSMHRLIQSSSAVGHDAYLLLNDDTTLFPESLELLLRTFNRRVEQDNLEPIVVGSTRNSDSDVTTYGGQRRIPGKSPISFELVTPDARNDLPCETMNGNCVLIPHSVILSIGNLDRSFAHAMGDTDYGLRASKAGIKLWVTPQHIGICKRNKSEGTFQDPSLPRIDRLRQMLGKKGLPIRCWLRFTKRHAGPFWPAYWLWPYFKVALL